MSEWSGLTSKIFYAHNVWTDMREVLGICLDIMIIIKRCSEKECLCVLDHGVMSIDIHFFLILGLLASQFDSLFQNKRDHVFVKSSWRRVVRLPFFLSVVQSVLSLCPVSVCLSVSDFVSVSLSVCLPFSLSVCVLSLIHI